MEEIVEVYKLSCIVSLLALTDDADVNSQHRMVCGFLLRFVFWKLVNGINP